MSEHQILRMRDFWTSILLIALSLFFIVETATLPFFDASSAGVDSGEWYNSAALTPFFIFGVLLLLSCALLWVAVRDGGAAAALAGLRNTAQRFDILWDRTVQRGLAVAAILLFYIFGLVPRVDFIIGSALTLAALIYGFHDVRNRPMFIALSAVASASLYALIAHFPQSEWARPHDDDWVTLVIFVALCVVIPVESRLSQGRISSTAWVVPLIAFLTPLFLVLSMAFGFRQNVPNRSGLLFSTIEYHYYVTLRPLFVTPNQ